MTVRFECPQCGHAMSAKADYAGKAGKCKCGAAVIVPGRDKMKFACRQCGKGISVSNRHAGKRAKCPTCQGMITVPVLGQLIEEEPPVLRLAVEEEKTVTVTCVLCNTQMQAPETDAGKIIECKECGSFVEVPRSQPSADYLDGGLENLEAGGQKIETESIGSAKCPSCQRGLPEGAPVCTRCGIYVKSGRPILTAWGMDADEVEEKAHGIVRAVSWLVPFGLYPVYSDALGHHKPYTTWAIAAATVLISIWFLFLEITGSSQMMSAKNLMLWSGDEQPSAERIQLLYEYTSYGDSQAFFAKREELADTTPEDKLDLAAHEALPESKQCFGQFKWYQLLTHAFLHGGIMHLVGNMVFFLVFGSRVNAAIGNIATAILYPILAVAAAVTHLAFMGAEPPAPMLGASGAVMGMAGAYLLLYPINKVYMVIWMRWGLLVGFRLSYKCFALRGFWVVLFYIMFDVIAVSLTMDDGTAHWAHIGGLVWGFVLAFVMLAARLAYSRNDMLSLILGKRAWGIIGTPAERLG